jgi:phospholipid-binding lipoprotein MlaA
MRRVAGAVGVAILATLLSGNTAVADETPPEAEPVLAEGEWDPLEPINRKVFWFNRTADKYAIRPAARAWNWVLPDVMQWSVRRFFLNLRDPVVAVNCLLQWKPAGFAESLGRFGVNSTVGVAGFMDPAIVFGLERRDEDFGQTLAVWGLREGPFLMTPILGPMNVRDGFGWAVDRVASLTPFFIEGWIGIAAAAVDAVNTRSLYLGEIEDAEAASLDFYVAVRNAYAQRRFRQVNDSTEVELDEEDLYFIDDDVD